ncbi:hypothetical protein EMPS_02367 [Entomortierella parvispora]|uniref:CAP-Gly domain-containing protein n=1 Tax=Entomortierella parvispora TaxID=205924 RepID=A0A9P3H5B0_9FUNG|nr:hypothetical protein EMPS_02367 [Entomortierella parvispora]
MLPRSSLSQGNPKSARTSAVGGPPQPQTGLQRRSFAPPSSTKLHTMTDAEASDAANRRRAESVGSDSGSAYAYQSNNGNNNSNSGSPSLLASPLSFRSPQPRRTSVSRPGLSPENSPYGSASNSRAATAAYSALAPLSPSSVPSQGSSPSPGADSPMGTRSTRLSAGGLSGPAGTGARLTKQPGLQRSTVSPVAGATGAVAGRALAAIPGSPAHNQNQLPPSLENVELGDRVAVESMGLTGYLRFVGTTEFKGGLWAGIELDTPTGKNDGSVAGVVYFTCRPNCGIFVLAAKIVKTELVLPLTSAAGTHLAPDSHSTPSPQPQPISPPAQHQQLQQPQPQQAPQKQLRPAVQTSNSQAAQAAARITAGSRASKYVGVTANQLKQRNGVPQPTNSKPPTTTTSPNNSPTTSRTLPMGSSSNANPQTTSPTPTTSVARTGLGARLGQANKTSLMTQSKLGTRTRGGSITSSAVPNGARPRTSPTPTRLMTSSRLLSSRSSDTPEASSTVSSPNLLDQASLVQMTESHQGDLAVQVHQLQLEIGVAVAENNLLKTEMNQTKSRLEVTRLLEKRDLSYEERVFLSKSLGRGGIEEKLGQELEDLHAMRASWEKETQVKDQEIKALTDKMAQAYIDAARSQKEKSALILEKAGLESRLKDLQDHGIFLEGSETVLNQAKVESLQKDLQQADERIEFLEVKLEELQARMVNDQEEVRKTTEDAMAANQEHFMAQLGRLEQERDLLQERLDDLDEILRVTTDALQAKLELANKDATDSKAQLSDLQSQQEQGLEAQKARDAEAEEKLKKSETELRESQSLLTKSERLVKSLEEKAKEHQSNLTKREQEIAALKLELEEVSGMVQSEEIDQMRKVWEHERRRLEESAEDDHAIIEDLQSDIEVLEANNEELEAKIASLESTIADIRSSLNNSESEVARLLKAAEEAQEQFAQERSALETKLHDSETSLQDHITATKERVGSLEAAASSADEWKSRYEALQSEMAQKTAMVEEATLKLTEAQTKGEKLEQEAGSARKNLEEQISKTTAEYEARITALQSAHTEELSKTQARVSELEAALAISAASSQSQPAAAGAEPSEGGVSRPDIEEEVASLKQMVHDLTRENVTVANVNKKLMLEHDNLMEAHKHVETECLKLMDEVERLHAESLAAATEDDTDDGTQVDTMENTEPKEAPVSQTSSVNQSTSEVKQGIVNQSQSVIRLEVLLKEKQTLLDRLTQAHATEMRDLRQRYVELDRSKAYELSVLNKELTELESLIESKIFHEADLEEEVQLKQKQIDRLQQDIADLRRQLAQATTPTGHSANGSYSSAYMTPSRSTTSSIVSTSSQRTSPRAPMRHHDEALFCEICEEEGHDIVTCTAVFGSGKYGRKLEHTPFQPAAQVESEDGRPYCDNCEEFGLHFTDECPNESVTY